MMDNNLNNNLLLQEVDHVPYLLRECFPQLLEHTRQFFSTEEIFDTRHIYLTGCGDSYMAALCAQTAFERMTGLNVSARPAMTQSYYTAVPTPEKNNLVLGLSNSGETSRVVEAMRRMRQAGCRCAAITCNEKSRLAGAAHKALILDIPAAGPGPVPGVGSFIIPLMALYLLAIRFGEVRGQITMDMAGQMRRDLGRMAEAMADSLQHKKAHISAFAQLCMDGLAAADGSTPVIQSLYPGDGIHIEIIGAGPCYGAAEFGAAKLVEALGIHATAIDMEEFAHVAYFEKCPNRIPTIVLGSSRAAAAERIHEICDMLQSLGRPVLYINHEEMDECWLPPLYCVDLALLAGCMSQWSSEPYFRGFQGVWESGRCVGVKDSRIIVEEGD